jgi:hypothetical protein
MLPGKGSQKGLIEEKSHGTNRFEIGLKGMCGLMISILPGRM